MHCESYHTRRSSYGDSTEVWMLCLLLWRILPLLWQMQPSPLNTGFDGELGCSPTLSFLADPERYRIEGPFVYFDPLRLADEENFAEYRESELKHGRVAMLAMSEVILVPVLKRFGGLPLNFPEGISGLPGSIVDYAKILGVSGLLELFVFVQRDPKDMPGDYGVGFFGVRDKTANENQLVVELEHGRLAMMGVIGFVVSDLLTNGVPWLQQWLNLLEQWVKLTEGTGK